MFEQEITSEAERCPIGRKVVFLSQPEAYAEGPAQVEAVETHLSWVFLTDAHAYKLKKPVRTNDAHDLRRIAQRQANCAEELRLNQRLTRGVYQRLVPLCLDGQGALALEGDGEVVDWLVEMRRLPGGQMLDRAIQAEEVDGDALRKAMGLLVGMYRAAGPATLSPAQYRARLAQGVEGDRRALVQRGYGLPRATINQLAAAQHAMLRDQPELFDARVAAGRVVEGHGDLRPEHICLRPLAVIDCLEFDSGLRTLDTADEAAFLALECERAGAGDVGGRAFQAYLRESDDQPPSELVRFYRRYRAMRRAKVAIWHLDDPGVPHPERWVARALRYLELVASDPVVQRRPALV